MLYRSPSERTIYEKTYKPLRLFSRILMERTKIIRDILILFSISAIVLLWGLGTGSLCSWDEGFYASVSREILKTGDWINLHWKGAPWSDKPPLYMWVTASFYTFFGTNEFSVRLFSALCGMGTIIATYMIALKLYSRRAGLAAGLILLSNWTFIWSAKMGMLDSTLTFFTTLSFLMFLIGRENRTCLFLCPIIFTCAFLTKGTGAMIIPVVIFLYAIFSGNLTLFRKSSFIAGFFVALVPLLWWHWAAFSNYGDGFIRGYLLQHLLHRTTTIMDGHTGDIFTYFSVIPNKGRPWAVVGFALIPLILWKITVQKQKQHLLPFIWAITVFTIFSAVRTKLYWYVAPIYPALAIMAGWACDKLFRKYTAAIICIVAFFSLVYLTIDKNIFDLDYSPAIKQFAENAEKHLPQDKTFSLYGIEDPSMQFYLGDTGENVRNQEDLQVILTGNGNFIIIKKEYLASLPEINRSIILQDENFAVIKTD